MPTQIRCPTCETLVRPSNADSAGSRVRCPKCNTVFTKPDQGVTEPLPRRAAPPRDKGRALPDRAEEDRPRSSRRRREDPSDDDDDRPRHSKRRLDDRYVDYEDSPQRRKTARSRRNVPVLLLILGGIGLVLILGCGAAGLVAWRLANPKWQDFNSPEGGFTATYPGTPQKSIEIHPLNGGTSTLFHTEADLGRIRFIVGYTDAPPEGFILIDPDTLLDAGASFITTVKNKRLIQIDGHPGIEVTGDLVQNGIRVDVTDRIYLVNRRMYHVMVETQVGHRNPADSAKFLDSFRLNGSGGRAGAR